MIAGDWCATRCERFSRGHRGLAPYFGPLIFGFGWEWLFWLLCPVLYVIVTTKLSFQSGRHRWTLLRWLLAPISSWSPGQILLMFLIFMFGSSA